jgi:hypothetical protein
MTLSVRAHLKGILHPILSFFMMEIETIHSFLAGPGKGLEDQEPVKGTSIEKSGKLFIMLSKIYDEAHVECIYDISFLPQDGAQQNDCRDEIIQYTRSGKIGDGRLLAERLQKVTTNRSGMGLFFLMKGTNAKKTRIVISRFPADTGILAEEEKSSLNIEYVERVFMKNAKAYKSAMYEGTSFDNDFWSGRAIDKQISGDLTISDYWITDFLISDFSTTGERGTRRLAIGIKTAINKGESIDLKEEMSAAVRLAKGLNGKVLSAKSFATHLGLSEPSQQLLMNEIKGTLYDEKFKFNFEEFNKLIAFKTIELDNGAFLSAQAEDFNNVFSSKESTAGKTAFTTVGKIINEKVRKGGL